MGLNRDGLGPAFTFNTITTTDISQEEDGDLAEWSGGMNASVVTDRTISGSTYAISMDTDGSEQLFSTSFQEIEYRRFSFHLYGEGENGEIIMFDSDAQEPMFCVFWSGNKDAIYWSDPFAENTFLEGDDLVGGDRRAGTSITDSGVNGQYNHVEVFPDWDLQTADVYLNGSIVLSDITWSSASGVPDTCYLTQNAGSSEDGEVVDEIVADFGARP